MKSTLGPNSLLSAVFVFDFCHWQQSDEISAQFPLWGIRLRKEWITLARSKLALKKSCPTVEKCGIALEVHCLQFSTTTSNYSIMLFICSQLKGKESVEEWACKYMMSSWQRNPHPHWNMSDKSDGRWAQNCQTRSSIPTWSVYYSTPSCRSECICLRNQRRREPHIESLFLCVRGQFRLLQLLPYFSFEHNFNWYWWHYNCK